MSCSVMKKQKLVGLLLISLVAAYLIWPEDVSGAITQINPLTEKHTVNCDLVVKRGLGNPYIDSYSCGVGGSCGGLSVSSLDVWGDYRGKAEMRIGGVIDRKDYTIGLGITSPAQTTIPFSGCVPDGSYGDGILRIYNGEGNAILDSRGFSAEVGA